MSLIHPRKTAEIEKEDLGIFYAIDHARIMKKDALTNWGRDYWNDVLVELHKMKR